MHTRRVVTSHSSTGKAVFASDGPVPTTSFEHVPGFSNTLIWRTPPRVPLPAGSADPTININSLVPEPGATHLMLVTFPPDSVMASADFDPAAAGAEYSALLPGLAEKFEMDNPGMHTTDTVDYGILLEGEIHLELDDGVNRKLQVHDIVIQNGTRHAWRNRSNTAAKMLFVLVGAVRRP
jgi:hypothetical protein